MLRWQSSVRWVSRQVSVSRHSGTALLTYMLCTIRAADLLLQKAVQLARCLEGAAMFGEVVLVACSSIYLG